MNTLEQPLSDSHEDLIVDGPRISLAASRTPGRALTQFAGRRHWKFLALDFVMSLSSIALLVHALRSAFGDPALTRQEFEGLGVVVCALAYIGVFLWRLSRALAHDAQRVEGPKHPSEIPSAVAREVNTGK
jgi:hypothetical protein